MSRWRYLFQRLLLSIPVILFGITFTFVALRMGPLDPVAAILGPESGGSGSRQQIIRRLGLNQPLWKQYIDFTVQLITFDLGQSWVLQNGTDVTTMIRTYAPRTLWLGFWSILLPLFIGIPLGFYAGLNPNTLSDYAASFGGIVWRAMPNFWLAIMFLALLRESSLWYTFGIEIGSIVGSSTLFLNDFSLTTLGQSIKKVLPPAIVLGSASMGTEMRIGRTAVLETINSNYVETAKAKGLSSRVIVWKHVFRNALIPLVPVITNEAFILIGGSVIVESIFGINGLGYLFFQSAVQGDLPLTGSLMFIFILAIVGINIFQDILYTILDPRVGYTR